MSECLIEHRKKLMALQDGDDLYRRGEPPKTKATVPKEERKPSFNPPPVPEDFGEIPVPSLSAVRDDADAAEREDEKRRMFDLALKIEQWTRDPWRWLVECVKTQDEADERARVKRFPDKPYLEHVVRTWQREPILAIPKSRRMMATWLMVALHLHKALFFPRSAVFVQSKKEEDSDFLLGPHRMLFIYHNLPPNVPWPRVKKKYANLAFDNGSYVKGIAQGADQLRQYTASAILCDEMAFWEDAESTWTSLKPTIQGGGKVTMISSAQPGFFQRIVEGRLRNDVR